MKKRHQVCTGCKSDAVWLVDQGLWMMYRQNDPQCEYALLCVECANAFPVGGDGLDTQATVAVTVTAGNGQAIPDGHFALIGVCDLNQEIFLANAAVKFDPSAGGVQFGDCVESVLKSPR